MPSIESRVERLERAATERMPICVFRDEGDGPAQIADKVARGRRARGLPADYAGDVIIVQWKGYSD